MPARGGFSSIPQRSPQRIRSGSSLPPQRFRSGGAAVPHFLRRGAALSPTHRARSPSTAASSSAAGSKTPRNDDARRRKDAECPHGFKAGDADRWGTATLGGSPGNGAPALFLPCERGSHSHKVAVTRPRLRRALQLLQRFRRTSSAAVPQRFRTSSAATPQWFRRQRQRSPHGVVVFFPAAFVSCAKKSGIPAMVWLF